jgi:DGQHR domain-containing protein
LEIKYSAGAMITVPARRVKQFGVEFFQAGLSAKDIDRLVKFEVLGYSGGPDAEQPKSRSSTRSRVNWDSLERRISESETAYQRPVIRRKIDELATYYRECKDAGSLPAIPGAVIITSEKRFTFTPVAGHHDLGLLQIPEEHGVLRVLDGQHRLLALHALSQAGESLNIEVPAVLFDTLDARQIVELFVTINAKHTRLNPSHIISLSGRKLYPDPNQALAHDIIRSLNDDDTSPLHSEIKMLGTGRGRVSQAPLAEEMVDLFETVEKVGGSARIGELRQGAKRFFLNYVKAIAVTFPQAWAGRKYSIKTGAALRAFIRVAPDVMARAKELKRDAFDLHAIRDAIKPWAERLRDRRFETEGEWKLKLAGGTRGTVDVLTRELRDALR